MIIRMILLGLVGAGLAITLDRTFTSIVLAFFCGMAVSEYLRIQKVLRQLQHQMEGLQTLDNLQNLEQLEAKRRPQQEGVSVSSPTAEPVKQHTDQPAAPERIVAHSLRGKTPLASAQPKDALAAVSPADDDTPQHAKVAPRRVRAKKPPNALQSLIGRTSMPTRIGIIVLFFGVSFLLRYAAQSGFFPVEARLLLVVIFGGVIYQVGRKLQARDRGYGLLLRGGAIGIWYLSCYAAFSLYHLVGASMSFAILAGLSGFTAWSAARHDTKAMALLGIVGGFLTPVLLSTGQGSHVMLFSYYAVINAGIVAIAYHKTWPELPTAGFIFTFGIGTLWGASSYQPQFFSTTEPFLLLSAIFYLCVPLLFANQVGKAKAPIYGNVIVFGTPAIAFTLQLLLVADFDNGDAWSAFGFAAVYAAVLALLWRWLSKTAPVLRDAFIAIAAVFFTLGVGFVFEQDVAGALWALEAMGGVWLASRQQRAWGCYLSLLILLGAGALWLLDIPPAGARFLLNSAYLQMATIGLAGLGIAFVLDKHPGWLNAFLPNLAAGWASVWWLAGGAWQINYHYFGTSELPVFGLYVLCTSAALLALYYVTTWKRGGSLSSFGMLLAGVLGLIASTRTGGPLTGVGTIVWPLTVVYFYAATYLLSDEPSMAPVCRASYGLATALVVAIGGAEFYILFVDHFPTIAGRVIGISAVPLLVFWFVQHGRLWRQSFDDLHRNTISVILAAFLMLCFYVGLTIAPGIESSAGKLWAWPLNLTQFALLVSIALWWKAQHPTHLANARRSEGWLFIGASAFLLANAVLLRFIHIVLDIPYNAGNLWGNGTVQTTLSIFWTLCGMAGVMWSSRNQHYLLWNVGIGLLGIVVLKLFLVDLAQSGTIERIVSFIAVGLLLMAVGWKSPRPDKTGAQKPLSPSQPLNTQHH